MLKEQKVRMSDNLIMEITIKVLSALESLRAIDFSVLEVDLRSLRNESFPTENSPTSSNILRVNQLNEVHSHQELGDIDVLSKKSFRAIF